MKYPSQILIGVEGEATIIAFVFYTVFAVYDGFKGDREGSTHRGFKYGTDGEWNNRDSLGFKAAGRPIVVTFINFL